jgi:hypothetical protein
VIVLPLLMVMMMILRMMNVMMKLMTVMLLLMIVTILMMIEKMLTMIVKTMLMLGTGGCMEYSVIRAQHGVSVSVGKTRNLERVRVRHIKKSGSFRPFKDPFSWRTPPEYLSRKFPFFFVL